MFDNHPQRLHLFDNDRYPSMDLDNIDFCALHQIEATHLLSQTQIQYKFIKLEENTENLFLYRIIFDEC